MIKANTSTKFQSFSWKIFIFSRTNPKKKLLSTRVLLKAFSWRKQKIRKKPLYLWIQKNRIKLTKRKMIRGPCYIVFRRLSGRLPYSAAGSKTPCFSKWLKSALFQNKVQKRPISIKFQYIFSKDRAFMNYLLGYGVLQPNYETGRWTATSPPGE